MLNFGKSVSDNGWGMFTGFLKYKLEEQGKKLVRWTNFSPAVRFVQFVVTGTQRQKILRSESGIVRSVEPITTEM